MSATQAVDLRDSIRTLMQDLRWSKDTMAGKLDVSFMTLNGWLNGGDSAKCETNARLFLEKRTPGYIAPAVESVRESVPPHRDDSRIPAGFRAVMPNTRPLSGMEVILRKGYIVFADDALKALRGKTAVAVHLNDADKSVLFVGTDKPAEGFRLRGHSKSVTLREISGGIAHGWMLANGYQLNTGYLAEAKYGGVVVTPTNKS